MGLRAYLGLDENGSILEGLIKVDFRGDQFSVLLGNGVSVLGDSFDEVERLVLNHGDRQK